MKEKCVQKYLENFKNRMLNGKEGNKSTSKYMHVSDVSFNVVTLLDNREI